MYIFQLERKLLKDLIAQNNHFIKGRVVDIGAGKLKRYKNLFLNVDKYITLDKDADSGCDIIADCTNIPVEDNYFDSIICTQVLGDIPDLKQVSNEFYRVLKKGGHVLLSESFFNELHSEPNDFWRFTPYSFKVIFPADKWQIIKIERVGRFWDVLAQITARYIILRFNLYNHKFWGRMFSVLNKLLSYVFLFFDKIDRSVIADRFSLGWLVIIKKI